MNGMQAASLRVLLRNFRTFIRISGHTLISGHFRTNFKISGISGQRPGLGKTNLDFTEARDTGPYASLHLAPDR